MNTDGYCYNLLNTTIDKEGRGVVIKNLWGETGYYRVRPEQRATQTEVDAMNAVIGITRAEAEAMQECAIFNKWGRYKIILESIKKHFPDPTPEQAQVTEQSE